MKQKGEIQDLLEQIIDGTRRIMQGVEGNVITTKSSLIQQLSAIKHRAERAKQKVDSELDGHRF